MKKSTIYWIVGIAGVIGLGVLAHKNNWLGTNPEEKKPEEKKSSAAAGHGQTNREARNMRRCFDRCNELYPNAVYPSADYDKWRACHDGCNDTWGAV